MELSILLVANYTIHYTIAPKQTLSNPILTCATTLFIQDYSVNFYLRQRWNDPRLTWGKPPYEHLKEIRLENHMWTEIWIPDTFFRNEKKANFHEVTVSNRLIRLQNNGDLFYVTKYYSILQYVYL